LLTRAEDVETVNVMLVIVALLVRAAIPEDFTNLPELRVIGVLYSLNKLDPPLTSRHFEDLPDIKSELARALNAPRKLVDGV